MKSTVRVVVLAPAMLVAVALAGCSSTSSPGATTSTTATTVATSGSASTAGSTTTSSGAARCVSSGLSGTVAGSEGAAGTLEVTVGLKNTSSSSCTLYGYPGGLLLDASGNALPTTVVRGGSYHFTSSMSPTTVSLAPGTSAFFNIGYTDVVTGSETSCPSSASLEVTPPNDVNHLVVPAQLVVCNHGTLTFSPVFASGSAASQTTAPPGP